MYGKGKMAVVSLLAVSFIMLPVFANGNKDSSAAPETSKKPVEIVLWHYFDHEADALMKFVDEYNKMQSEIHIECDFVSRDELTNQYTIGAVSGKLPDIGMVDSPNMASYIALGVFEDITDELKGWDGLQYFYKGPLSSCMQGDRIYGLPNNSNCLALCSNMDILNAAGFTEPPKTWKEFYEVAKKTTDPSKDQYGFAMCAISTEEGTYQFIPWLYSAGATYKTLDSPEAVNALTFLSKLVENGYMSKEVINWNQGDAYNAFLAEKAAMYEAGTWQISTIDSDLAGVGKKMHYKFSFLPKDKENATVIGGENFGLCTGCKDKKACVKFLEFMQSAKNNADWCEIAGKLPVRSDAVQYKDMWTADERYKVFNDSMPFAVARGPNKSWPSISKAMYSAEQSVFINKSTPEEALKEAAAVVTKLLDN